MNGKRRSFALCLALLALACSGIPEAGAAPADERAARRLLAIAPSTYLSPGEYGRMRLGGVRHLRVPMFWEDLQPTADGYDFAKSDQVLIVAAYYGIQVRPFVMGVPQWLQERSGSSAYPPVSTPQFRRAWKRLLAALVERYGPGGELWRLVKPFGISALPIRDWQIWNEPNARTYFRPGETAPQEYAKLLKLSASTIRRHDRGAKVIAAGVFLTPLDGITMPEFVRRLYRVPRIERSFDALALHPYARNVAGVLKQIRLARRLMRSSRDEDAELWITELGWPTERSYGRGLFVKTEAGQKRQLARTFGAIIDNRREWRIGSLTWYTWRDNDFFANCDLCRFSGLFREDYTPKPAWTAFVNLLGGKVG